MNRMRFLVLCTYGTYLMCVRSKSKIALDTLKDYAVYSILMLNRLIKEIVL